MSGGTQRECRERYAKWLTEHVTRNELLGRVRDVFGRKGPALTPSLRRELHQLIDEQASRTLARCIALNEHPEEDDAFVDCRQDAARESSDPYLRHGVRRVDFL